MCLTDNESLKHASIANGISKIYDISILWMLWNLKSVSRLHAFFFSSFMHANQVPITIQTHVLALCC